MSSSSVSDVIEALRSSSQNQNLIIETLVHENDDQLDEAILNEIEQAVRSYSVQRQPTVTRQVVRVPGPAAKVKTVVRRLATPVPDIIERVVVVQPTQDIVNVVIERPTTPPPQIQEKKVIEKPLAPVVSHQIVRVQPRSMQVPQMIQRVASVAAPAFSTTYSTKQAYATYAPAPAVYATAAINANAALQPTLSYAYAPSQVGSYATYTNQQAVPSNYYY